MKNLRILSLLPAATEIVYLLGLEKYLVGVSHDCDYPLEVKKIPKITSSSISNAMTSLEIDMAVKKLGHRGNGVFHIDQQKLKELKPDLILTQELCEVCAVGFNQVKKSARILDSDAKIVSLEPESVEDIVDNIRLIGKFCNKKKAVESIIGKLEKRVKNLKLKMSEARAGTLRNSKTKPQVLIVEWLDPVMVAGHWVPEMVERAGGKMLITKPGEKSRLISFTELGKLEKVDILVISPCGFDIDRMYKEIDLMVRVIQGLQRFKGKTYLVDGNSYMTRPGPRIVDGIEILSEILYPEIFSRKHSKVDWVTFK